MRSEDSVFLEIDGTKLCKGSVCPRVRAIYFGPSDQIVACNAVRKGGSLLCILYFSEYAKIKQVCTTYE